MAKQEENKPQEVKPILIDNTVDLSKEGVKPYLEDAAERMSTKDNKVPWHGGRAMHLAVAEMILDIAKITGEHRKQVLIYWESEAIKHKTLWVGCNASQGRQAYTSKTAIDEKVADYIKNME